MGSTPIIGTFQNAIVLGDSLGIYVLVIAIGRARKRTKTPPIRQVFGKLY
jgi:hypothetical protein